MGSYLKTKILLTGSNGFLGRHLATELAKYNVELIKTTRQKLPDYYSCDLTSETEVSALINKISPDLLIHCAAFVPKTNKEYKSAEILSKNQTILQNILKASKVPIVYISSMTVYGPSNNMIRHESDSGRPESLYGLSKYENELLLNKDGRNSLSIRIPGLFGKNRTDGVIFNIINSMCNNKNPSLPKDSILWAAMDVEDAAKIIAKLSIELKPNGHVPINVAYPEVYSINRLVNICEEIFNSNIKYEVTHPEFMFNLSKLKKLSMVPTNSLKKSLIKLKKQHELRNNKEA